MPFISVSYILYDHQYRKLWKHMTKMAVVLSEVCKGMSCMSDSDYLFVKELLISPTWKYLHAGSQQDHKQPVISTGDGELLNISGAMCA